MNREEAIKLLKYNSNVIHKNVDGKTDPNEVEALDMAIKALEQEPCEDAISKQAVITVVKDWWENGVMVIDDIRNLPPVTPTKCIAIVKFSKEDMRELVDEKIKDIVVERKKGKWIYDKTIQNWRCSECNETPKALGFVGTDDFMVKHFRFCNHCGAEMEVENNG